MDYPIENLNDEKFQQLCQALIGREFKGLQAFPVGQPDGGRDALTYIRSDPNKGFVLYQIKFVRKPSSVDDPHKWLLRIVEEELPKILKQIPKGARQYVLITNINGTAHSEVGSIDKLNRLLTDSLPIPATGWWRDDINRRLDDAWDLKWVYPEIMTGPDLIRALIEAGLTQDQPRRASAIRAFVREQFETDREVKFKQADLQNKLLDLFIDVPIGLPRSSAKKLQSKLMYARWFVAKGADAELSIGDSENTIVMDSDGVHYHNVPSIGAATFLLSSEGQARVPRLVLEGAPGQGKSTITQYICQVHRMRILKSSDELNRLPPSHTSTAVRLPFKVDLRDFSEWLAKRNPFSADPNEPVPANWRRSLESFLAALVAQHSGGIDFDTADLAAIAEISAILLVLDGLDEVADIQRRKDVVEEIVRGVNRLEENSVSIQVIVTSRPAAFANSPGLPDDRFPYFQLLSVTRPLIEHYTTRWLRAKQLSGKEGAEVRKILKEKLDQPHLRDLARNPMQLAILLGLIHTRGASLPDKRTALYDSYVDLFFNRESEKNPTVRTYRDLLINIHRYLAWVLHSEAEQGAGRGSVSEDRLQQLLRSYLEREGHNPELAGTLFSGMVERVVALVSRVQGTYEFEVQPLREYFAARYLYDTSPYSPTGANKPGTLPDRFDAIARNFYWLNVTRFYAGCYSKGELSSLIDRLTELTKESGYRLISHPRILAATLLADWVFAQYPKTVKKVVELVLDGMGLRYALSSNSRRVGSGIDMILPEGCGKTELLDRCFDLLRQQRPRDFALDLIDLLNANSTLDELTDRWLAEQGEYENTPDTWLEYGLHLGVLGSMPLGPLLEVAASLKMSSWQIATFCRARRFEVLEKDEIVFGRAVETVLTGQYVAETTSKPHSIIDILAQVVEARRYGLAFQSPHSIPLKAIAADNRQAIKPINVAELTYLPNYSITAACVELAEKSSLLSELPAATWAAELHPWNELIETGRRLFGDRWAFTHIANIAAGIKSSTEKFTDHGELFDDSRPLCKRLRYARLRAGQAAWWEKTIESITSPGQSQLSSLALWTWASANTIASIIEPVQEVIDQLSYSQWLRVERSVARALWETSGVRRGDVNLDDLPDVVSPRTAALLTRRASKETSMALFEKYLVDYDGSDLPILRFCQSTALSLASAGRLAWGSALRVVERSYANGGDSQRYAYQHAIRQSRDNPLPKDEAVRVAETPDRFPGYIVALAESVCRESVAESVVPVGLIATQDHWFE